MAFTAESKAGTGPVILKVIPVAGAASLFWYVVGMYDTESVGWKVLNEKESKTLYCRYCYHAQQCCRFMVQVTCSIFKNCVAINVSVQHNGGLLPDIILLTQCYNHRGTRLNAMNRFCICSL